MEFLADEPRETQRALSAGGAVGLALMPARELLFSCKGRIDQVTGEVVEVTVFKNDRGDDPRGLQLGAGDFRGEGLAEGRWFIYEQYLRRGEGADVFEADIRLLPDEPYTEDEAIDAYQRYLRLLPDEF